MLQKTIFNINFFKVISVRAQSSAGTMLDAWRRKSDNFITIKQMYAIVEINGQQFKAEEGKKLFVQHIKDAAEGQAVEYEKVLLVDADGAVKVGAPTVEGAKVTAEVVKPLVKGDKVIVFKMKRRKDYRVKNGHRQQYTEIVIKSVIA